MASSTFQSGTSFATPRRDFASLVSESYAQARDRFLTAAAKLDAFIESHQILSHGPNGEELWIYVARIGSSQPKRMLILSSGLHGVEGFFGSAAQTGFLEDELRGASLPDDGALLILHALNPYGFAWLRRFNENNVDLNRNFLLPDEVFSGSPDLYGHLLKHYPVTTKPKRFSLFLAIKLLYTMLRHGSRKLRMTVPVGQYDYPRGPFFGGKRPEPTHTWLKERMPQWLNGVEDVAHLDFHTGLGNWGTHKLLIEQDPDTQHCHWWKQHFEPHEVECVKQGNTSYTIRGSFGRWCEHMAQPIRYRFATAEFGTYRPMRILAALIAENRAYWCGLKQDPQYEWTQHRIKEAFVPADFQWREQTVRNSIDVIQRAWMGLFKTV